MPISIISSENLLIREISIEDTDFIVTLRSEPQVFRFFRQSHKITNEEHQNWFNNRYRFDENRVDFIAIEKDSEKAVGIYGVRRETVGDSEFEVSYITSENFQHRGYASEAVETIIEWAKKAWNSQSIKAVIHPDNIVSIAFIKKLRFHFSTTYEGFDVYRREI